LELSSRLPLLPTAITRVMGLVTPHTSHFPTTSPSAHALNDPHSIDFMHLAHLKFTTLPHAYAKNKSLWFGQWSMLRPLPDNLNFLPCAGRVNSEFTGHNICHNR
jgi:hypothetical protein